MADPKIEQFAMHDEDLGGHSIADVACISCRPLCTSKIIRRYHGGPLFMCKRRDATVEFLANEFARMHPDGVDDFVHPDLEDGGASADSDSDPDVDGEA